MIDWIRSLLCDHKWRLTATGKFTSHTYGDECGHFEDYVCSKCLKTKIVKWT